MILEPKLTIRGLQQERALEQAEQIGHSTEDSPDKIVSRRMCTNHEQPSGPLTFTLLITQLSL